MILVLAVIQISWAFLKIYCMVSKNYGFVKGVLLCYFLKSFFHFWRIALGTCITCWSQFACIVPIQLHLLILQSLCLSHVHLITLHFLWRSIDSYSPFRVPPPDQRCSTILSSHVRCPGYIIRSSPTYSNFTFQKKTHKIFCFFFLHIYWKILEEIEDE